MNRPNPNRKSKISRNKQDSGDAPPSSEKRDHQKISEDHVTDIERSTKRVRVEEDPPSADDTELS